MLSRAVRPVGTHVAKRGIVDTMRSRVAMANAARAFASQRAPQHSGGRAGAVARRDSPRRSQPTLMSVFDDLLPFSNDPFFRPLLSSMRAFDRDLIDRDLLHTVNMNLDIGETPKEYVVRAELPGIKKEDVKITFSDGVLTMSAERKEERVEGEREGGAEKEGNKDEEGHRTHYSDFVYGHVERSLRIPEGADPESIAASMDNGVLTVKIAKTKPQEAKTIRIQ